MCRQIYRGIRLTTRETIQTANYLLARSLAREMLFQQNTSSIPTPSIYLDINQEFLEQAVKQRNLEESQTIEIDST